MTIFKHYKGKNPFLVVTKKNVLFINGTFRNQPHKST